MIFCFIELIVFGLFARRRISFYPPACGDCSGCSLRALGPMSFCSFSVVVSPASRPFCREFEQIVRRAAARSCLRKPFVQHYQAPSIYRDCSSRGNVRLDTVFVEQLQVDIRAVDLSGKRANHPKDSATRHLGFNVGCHGEISGSLSILSASRTSAVLDLQIRSRAAVLLRIVGCMPSRLQPPAHLLQPAPYRYPNRRVAR